MPTLLPETNLFFIWHKTSTLLVLLGHVSNIAIANPLISSFHGFHFFFTEWMLKSPVLSSSQVSYAVAICILLNHYSSNLVIPYNKHTVYNFFKILYHLNSLQCYCVDPDQLASEASRSNSTLLFIHMMKH